jgi:hypothetical protein
MRVIVWTSVLLILHNAHPNFLEFRIEGLTSWAMVIAMYGWAGLMDLMSLITGGGG